MSVKNLVYNRGMDLMCLDYQQAAENREMVRLKQNIEGYLFIEALVRSWPRKKPLPEWLYGHLPVVNGQEAKELYRYGVYEINENNA